MRPIVALCAALVLCASATADSVPHWNHWLCFPGAKADWCTANLKTTTVTSTNAVQTADVSLGADPPIDCFYVYPTVSHEQRPYADLRIQEAEEYAAIDQAAWFERDCRVYAPVYRQHTTNGDVFGKGNPSLPISDVFAAWHDYLAHYNHGRGVVLIGHSQGSGVLEDLLQKEFDNSPKMQKLLVSALLIGGDVAVKKGKTTGGDFKHLSACTSSTQTGCIVAYSSWDQTPPKNAGLEDAFPDEQVLCVNPAAPGSTKAEEITPIFPQFEEDGMAPYGYMPKAFWIRFPHMYTAQCVTQGSRSWLLIKRIPIAGDKRPKAISFDEMDGLHPLDMTLAMENLVALVNSQAKAWLVNH